MAEIKSTQETGCEERVSNAVNELRGLMERFENRLTFENLALAERYVCSQIALHIHYRSSISFNGRDDGKLCAIFQEEES